MIFKIHSISLMLLDHLPWSNIGPRFHVSCNKDTSFKHDTWRVETGCGLRLWFDLSAIFFLDDVMISWWFLSEASQNWSYRENHRPHNHQQKSGVDHHIFHEIALQHGYFPRFALERKVRPCPALIQVAYGSNGQNLGGSWAKKNWPFSILSLNLSSFFLGYSDYAQKLPWLRWALVWTHTKKQTRFPKEWI